MGGLMDTEMLARIQFALNISFHYIFPPISIGLGLCLVIMEALFLKTKNPLYEQMTKFWVKLFALVFAVGVATGIVMVFAFGNSWSNFSRFVGDVFGSILGAEGIFAFFLEAGFLGVLLFGWDKVSPKIHFLSTVLVCVGAHFSAVWIVIANSWMQTPAGFEIVGEGARAHAVITNFWDVLSNPSAFDRLWHVIVGCWLAGSLFVLSVSAFYILKKKFTQYAIIGVKIGTVVTLVAAVLQFFAGDASAKGVADNQPTKFASLEGIYETQSYAPLSLGGWVDEERQEVHSIAIPGLLSLLTYGDAAHPVRGLNTFPKEDLPPVGIVFQAYHLMIFMWALIVVAAILGIWVWKRRERVGRWPLYFLIASVLFPQIANQAGWFTAEIGRQPWVVYNVLRTSQGVSHAVSSEQLTGSIIMFSVLYTLVFILFLYLLDHKIKEGPAVYEASEAIYKKQDVIGGKV